MSPVWKSRLLLIALAVATAQAVSWLIDGSTSPLSDYLLWNPALRNGWGALNLPGSYVGVLVSGNLHQPSHVGTVIGIGLQWAMLAFLFSWVIKGRGQTQ